MQTAVVRRAAIDATVRLMGQVVARSEASVTSPTTTQVRRVLVSIGAFVTQGQPLVETAAAERQRAADDARRREAAAVVDAEQTALQIQDRLDQATEEISRLQRNDYVADLQLAQSTVIQARAGLQRSEADLRSLTAPRSATDIRAADQQIQSAQLALRRAEGERARVAKGTDPAELARAEAELAAAESAVQKTVETARGPGQGGDPARLQIAQRAVQAAQAALQIAQQPPAEIASAQALVVSSRGRSAREREAIRKLAQQQIDTAVARQKLEIQRAEADLARAVRDLQSLSRQPTEQETEATARSLNIALRALAAAGGKVATLKAGPSQLDIETAEAEVASARITVEQAQERRTAMDAGPAPEQLSVAQSAVESGRAALTVAQERVTELTNQQRTQAEQLRQAQARQVLFQGIASGSISSQEEAAKPGADPDVVDFALAQTELADARRQLAEFSGDPGPPTIAAPADGIITAIRTEQGADIGPDRPIVTMIRANDLVVRGSLIRPDGARIASGMTARVRLATSPTTDLTARVDQVDTSSSESVVDMAVNWSAPLPSTGTEAQADIAVERHEDALIVPRDAVRVNGNRSYVDVIEGGASRTVEVTTGLSNETDIEIVNGLQENQRVRAAPAGG